MIKHKTEKKISCLPESRPGRRDGLISGSRSYSSKTLKSVYAKLRQDKQVQGDDAGGNIRVDRKKQRTENRKSRQKMSLFPVSRSLSSNKGFTLIEMLVAVAMFSIVLVIAMGAILTIIDANRKAQTLSSVMTNLNFAFESMTRTIKTGVDPVLDNGVLRVDAIDLSGNTFTRRKVFFKREVIHGRGQIVRRIGESGDFIPITAPEVNITNMTFDLFGASVPPSDTQGPFDQPRTLITVEGVVTITSEIESIFKIQTTVSQRRLNIAGKESTI